LGSVLVPMIDKVATVMAALFDQMVQNRGIGGAMVSTFKSLGGAIGAVVGVISDIVSAFKQSHAWAVLLVAAVGGLTAGLIAYKTIVAVTTAVTKAWAAAQVLLNVAMDANPIVLIVAAIAALAAGLYIAYQKSETFRNIVNAVWGVIKTVTGAVWDFLTSLADLPGKLYAAGKGITEGVINGIKAVPGLLLDAAKWYWQTLEGAIKAYLGVYEAIGGWILARVIDGFKIVTDLLKSIGSWILNRIVDYIKLEIAVYKAVGSWVLNRIVDGFKVVTDLLATVGSWVKNRIVDFIKLEIDGVKAVGGWILNRIVDGFKIITGLLSTVGGWIKNRIGDFIRLEIDGLTNIGSWIVNRVVDGFKTVTKALETVGGWIKNRIVDFIHGEASGFKDVGGTIIGWIVDGFKGGVNLLVDLVNDIIDVINVIPGIPNIKHVGHVGGGGSKGKPSPGGPNGTGHLAKGGMVPGSGYGDKVPLHIAGKLAAMVEPGELVSVANRNATAALMGVNSAIPRFQTGGVFNTQEMSDLWRSKGGGASIADTMGVIGLVESGGKPWVRNPSGASGLWQILGQLVPGNLFNPGVNALNAIAKYKADGLHPWDSSRSKWEPLLGKKVGPDPLSLISKLPGVGDLPDWLKGTGKYVIDKVGDWIKDNVAKLIPGGGGGTKGPKGVGTFNGIPMADWVIDSLNYGRRHGAHGNPTSGYRPGYDPHTDSGSSEHQGTQYPHGAVDFGGYHDAAALAAKMSYVHATAGYKYPLLAPKGFIDDGHASGTGHQLGGIIGPRLPFLGSYHSGGVAPTEGYARVSAGERMTPAGQNGPLVNIEHAEFGSQIDVNSFAAKLGFKIATA
jgi:hypothetical protein